MEKKQTSTSFLNSPFPPETTCTAYRQTRLSQVMWIKTSWSSLMDPFSTIVLFSLKSLTHIWLVGTSEFKPFGHGRSPFRVRFKSFLQTSEFQSCNAVWASSTSFQDVVHSITLQALALAKPGLTRNHAGAVKAWNNYVTSHRSQGCSRVTYKYPPSDPRSYSPEPYGKYAMGWVRYRHTPLPSHRTQTRPMKGLRLSSPYTGGWTITPVPSSTPAPLCRLSTSYGTGMIRIFKLFSPFPSLLGSLWPM
jgi:hypothetical protein